MEVESCIPPGFRFHPTEEELVGYYLTRKVNSQSIDLDIITDIDLYRIEPWDLQASCKFGCEEQSEWYFFSHKDKKYPTGTRTKRATAAGFWKATGRDKVVLSKDKIIGMRKTLVFYWGRAPNGKKTDWIMHEYRLQASEHAPPQEEGWVVCRAFRKQIPSSQRPSSFRPWDTAPTNYFQYHSQFGSSQEPKVADFCPSQIMTPHNHVQNSIYEQSSNVEAQEQDSNGWFQQLEPVLIHHDWKTLDNLLSTDHQLCGTASCLSSSLPTVLAHLPCETFLDT